MDFSNLSDEELENRLATIEGRAQQITGIGQRRLEDMSDGELESRLAALESQPSAAEAQPQEPEPAQRDRMGIIDRVANQRIAQTGREDEFDGALGKANAVVHGLTPFTSHLHNARRKDQERADWAFVNLENWNEGSKKFKNEIDPKHQGKAEETKLGEDGEDVGVLDVLTDGDTARDFGRNLAGVAENAPLGAGHLVKWLRDKHREKNETTLYDYLRNRANDTSLESREIDEIDRQANGDPGKFQNLMRRALYAQMQHREQAKKDAAQREKDDPSRWYEDIATGTINNVGYTGEYIIGGALGGVGAIALPAAFSQPEREAALRTPEFDVDADGNLIQTSDGNSAGMALAKSTVGAVAEAAVERYLEKMLGVAYKGAKRIRGVGKVVGGIGDAVGGAAEGIEKALAAKLVKNPVGKFIVDAAKNFAKYSDKTGVQGLPMEMLEEHVQDFVDTVVGLDEQEAPLSEMGARARDFWHNKFLSKERNVDLLLGLVGTMAIQGAYAGTKEHARLAAMRHDQAGALKMLLDPKLVDGMSNDEVRHVYNLVTGNFFTRENVEKLLQQVDATSQEAVALTELKDLNNKDWGISSEEYDGAKSQFVPPTRETRPGVRELDYRPFTLKNGTTVMRAYDPNTGISIDRYSKTKFVVTNADGLRATVGGADESEAGQNALKMADKFSIIAQVENAKLPRKMDYIQKRVKELGGRDKFVVVPNMKTLLVEAPYLADDVDFNPDNSAVRLGDGRVVLVANNMRDAYEVNSNILHESGIHEGLRKEFTPEEKMALLKSMENEPRIRRYRERIDAQRLAAGKPAIDWSAPRYLEEQFAMVWDRRRADPRTSQKVEAWMRNLARKAGLPVGMNTADVEVMLSELQDKMRRGGGSVQMMDDAGMQNAFPNTEGGIDYGLEYDALDLADPNAPSGATEGSIEVRKMARADRIKANYPNLYAQGMENFDGDEDAAVEWISGILADEGRRGKLGEREEGIHGYRVAQKLENGEDLLPEDMDVLEENGFVGRILYTDFGYRRQKNGVWKRLAKPGEALPQSVAAPKAAPKPTVPVTSVPVTVKKSNRQIKAEHEKKFVESLKTKNGGKIMRLPASVVKTGDGRIVQFKEDADPKSGVVPGNELEGDYDETVAGLPVVGHFPDGEYETITGRHRIKRAQELGIDINVMVLEVSEDGRPGTISIADAEAIDAKANIKDGKGTIKDYIKFFRHAKMTKAEAEKEGLLGKKTQGRKAFALYNDATPELTAAVDFDGTAENDDRTITPEQAGIIAMNAPKDGHKLNGAVQRSMRDYCVKHPKANGDRLARLTQAKAHQLIQAEKDGQLKENGDGQMFLFADMAADVAATDKLDEIENYKEKRSTEYKKLANRIRDAKNSKTVIGSKSMGSILQISKEAAQELDLIDTETGDVTTDKKRLEDAAQEALGKAFMWTRMELPADMQDELEKALKLGKYAYQQDLPVQNEPAGDLKLPRPKAAGNGKGGSDNAKPTSKAEKPVSDNTKPVSDNTKKPTPQQTIDDDLAKAKAAADKHVVRYGNGMKGTLADMINSGGATLHPKRGLFVWDKGTPHVVTIGFEQFTPTKGELPYLIHVQREWYKKHPTFIEESTLKEFPELREIVNTNSNDFKDFPAGITDEQKKALRDHYLVGGGENSRVVRSAKMLPSFFINNKGVREKNGDALYVEYSVSGNTPTEWIAIKRNGYVENGVIGQSQPTFIDFNAAAETALGRPSNTKEAEKPTTTAPEKPQNGLSGVDLGENAADFDAALDSMWFSRELEDVDSGILPKDKWPKKSYHDVTGNYVYKLMRLNENGQIEAPMAEGRPVEFGAWYGAKDLSYNDKNGKRVVDLTFAKRGFDKNGMQKRSKKKGAAAGYPGLHFGTLPYMAHIGLSGIAGQKIFANADYVWVKVDVPYDMAQQYFTEVENAGGNADKVFAGRIPENGYYFRKTSPTMVGKWGVAGAMKFIEPLSDAEVEQILDDAQAENPSRQVRGKFGIKMPRYGGGEFDKETMRIEGRNINFDIAEEAKKLNLPAELTDSMERDASGEIMWNARGLEDMTEEEIQAHNMQAGIKAVRAFAAAGQTSFDKFARTIAARKPEIYAKIRNFIPGMWLSARMMGISGIEKIDEDGAKKVLEAVDQALSAPTIAGSAANSSPTASEEPTQATTPPAHGTRGEAISAAADEVLALIDKGEKFDQKRLVEIVGRHLGGSIAEGTFDTKAATDILELAVNRYMKNKGSLFDPSANASANQAVTVINRIRKILETIPTQTVRSEKMVKFQQFSTPPHEAFMAAWVANVKPGDVSLEPSAGIGGIAVFSKIAGADVIVNEIDTEGRAPILEQLGLSPKVYNFNAENLWTYFYPLVGKGEVKRPTVVVMNPPFSNSATTHVKDTIGIGGKHIEQALQMLAPGGRLVAIVGHGMAHDADSAKVRDWWKRIGEKYQVRADVTVNGDEYKKYGTTYDNNLIVIDKVAPDNTKTPVYGKIQSIDELPAMLEGVRNDRPTVEHDKNAERPGAKQGGSGSSAENGRGPKSNPLGRPRPDNGKAGNGKSGSGSSVRLPGRNEQPGNDTGTDEVDNGSVRGGQRENAGGNVSNGNDASRPDGNSGRGPDSDSTVQPGLTEQTAQKNEAAKEVGNGTFSKYVPPIVFPNAKKHPSDLVEPTAMAIVKQPDATYKLVLPQKVIDLGILSDAQLVQVQYACQAFERMLSNGTRHGYFIGDGTGVGKGREIVGIMMEQWLRGRRKMVWVSEKESLGSDARRDLYNFGLGDALYQMDSDGRLKHPEYPKRTKDEGPMPPPKIASIVRGGMQRKLDQMNEGILFSWYSNLRSGFGGVDQQTGRIVSTSKTGKKCRLQQIIDWFGKDYDGLIVFDEAHNAANTGISEEKDDGGFSGGKDASKQAEAVMALQKALPNARILYVSATGATEVSNLAYAERMGLWGEGTAFEGKEKFVGAMSKDISLMEFLSRDMKADGSYLARSLSYDGIVNRRIAHELTPDQVARFNKISDAWRIVLENFNRGLQVTGGANNKDARRVISAFWGAHQRFFNTLLNSMMLPSVFKDAQKYLDMGESVVFQLVSTGEAAQTEAMNAEKALAAEEGRAPDFDSIDTSPRGTLIQFVRQYFPVKQYEPQEEEPGKIRWVEKPLDNPEAIEIRERLIRQLSMMKMEQAPLDAILEEFGYENVAEGSGRTGRLEMRDDGHGNLVRKFVRRSKENEGKVEVSEFNSGKRRVLVFSKAMGTGASFHADRNFKNQTKRHHYLLEAGFGTFAAVQGLGRTHRSNETVPPEYILCSTALKGHLRFMTSVARRMQQLGSLTGGDRSSAGSGIFSENDNLENKYAQTAVKMVFKDAFKNDKPLFERMCSDLGLFKYMQDSETKEYKLVNSLVEKNGALRKDEELPDVKTFLNRLLGCKTQTQNEYFDMFHERMTKIIDQAIADGTYSPGIRKLQGVTISEKSRTELWKDPTRKTEIVEVDVGEKNTSKIGFHDAFAKLSRTGTPQFAIRDSDNSAVMYVYTGIIDPTSQKEKIVYVTPSGKTGSVLDGYIKLSGEKKNFTDLREVEASALWDKQFAETPDTVHSSKYFIDGSILPIFDRLGVDNPNAWRVTTTEGEKKDFLGMQVDANKVKDILRRFGKSVGSVTLGPQDVMNRILREGKRVELQNGWVLRRSNRATGAEIQIDNVYEDADIDALESNPYVHSRVNGRTSMFFVNQNIEDFTKFMDRYPAVPEEGGLGTVGVGSENKYVNMSREQQRVELANIIDGWQGVRSDADFDPANEKPWMESMNQLISVMPNDELKRASYDFQQYDKKVVSDPVHLLRSAIRKELKSRGEIVNEVETPELWYSRELEDDDTSSVAIHEVNAWRRARGLPEMKKHRPTSVAAIVRAGKTMASNRDEMERFIEVSARTPQNWTATEVNAVAQRRIQLEEDYDEKTRLINEAEMNGNREEAQRIREARDLTQDMLDTMDRAINKAKREWGLAGLARRFMLNRNGSFVRFSGELQSFAGRKLTEEEETGARMLWDAYREAQGKLDEETVRKTSELLKDIVRRHMATEEQQHRIGHGKTLKQIEDEYAYALDHIRVHANRAGGVLLGLPDGRKWIDALRRYHMAAALETGRKLTVDEMLAAIHADIDGMIRADDHDIMQIITGHGNTYEADNSELEKAMREQRALMNEYQKWEDMMTEGHLPDKTGLIRDEPTQTLRDAQKITRDLMREFMEQHPELMQMDASKRLKTVQDSLMKRWRNEIEDLQKAIDDGEKIMRAKNVMTYTPEMQELRRQLEEKRREYHEMFPPEPLTHEEKVSRALRVLQRKLAALQEKKAALENATTDTERENILRKSRGAKLEDESLEAVRDQIADLQEDIQDLHDLHFPAGTVDEFMAMVRRRKNALAKNIQRIETQLNNRDFAPQKREPSALAKRVAADPAVMEAVKIRNAASQRLMQERERFRRSVLPYNAGRALDWFDALTSAPRVFRTMLDLSATMTQGAALFTSHPVLGWQALVDSVKSFYSADNTDKIMAALYADPDYTEFQEMGGRVYNVSNLDEKTLPEEFRGISQKVFTIRGKQYGIDDIPGVKASERSFGVFLNALNLGVYKAIKASGGWGPTGPTDTQKKDIAISLNVASGYGYDNKGGRGAWDRVMSAALWAPRFAVSGFKMAVGWNILAPQWTGLTTERSYKDRMVSSKVAAQQYVRQVASMAAWTLLATLLMGRKDPEWLEEMLNPLSANFLNVRVGNTNLNFFGPIKQWWVFMSRMLTGKTMGRDGVVKNADQLQVAGRFARGKLSPLAGVAMDILDGKTFIGEKLVWDRSAEGAREKNGWKHVAASVGVPLSAGDLAEAFKENTLANALLLTPFVVAGAGKSTIAPEGDDAYNRKVNPYKALAKEYKAAMKAGDRGAVTQLRVDNPILNSYPIIESRLKAVQLTKKQLRDLEKSGRTPSESLLKRYDLEQKAVLDAIERAKK